MKIIAIVKRDGRRRLIYAPGKKMKAELRRALPALNACQLAICDRDAVHGFMPGRSPATAAIPHVGYRYTLSADLSEFFDSVSRKMLPPGVRAHTTKTMFPDRRARQGLPTSPAIANMAATKMDNSIISWCKAHGCVYTRYADDISISGNDKDVLLDLRKNLAGIVGDAGFRLNDAKTRIQWAGPDGDWTREVVGVGVGKTGIRPLRHSKRKERAARHAAERTPHDERRAARYRGIQEWNRLRHPKPIIEENLAQVKTER